MLLARPISHTSTQYMDFVKIFNISLDLSSIFILLILLGVELPLCIVVTIIECYNLFAGVKLSIRLFCFLYYCQRNLKTGIHQGMKFMKNWYILWFGI